MKNFILFFFLLYHFEAFAKIAVVKILKGEVKVKNNDKTTSLKMEDWVDEGMIITTAEKSFVKLVFIDKSTMNIGPKSEVKIESFTKEEASVFELVKGQIRSNVSKDYLQNPEKDKSKLLIKTKNAVMGVRGTDFLISTNGVNTSTVLFEGEIVFNSLPPKSSNADLEKIVTQGVRIKPGEFSVVKDDLPQPSLPSKLNVKQLELLEKNDSFNETKRNPAGKEEEKPKSIIPKGLNGQIISSQSSESSQEQNTARGFKDGDSIKPANGSILHLESGTVIPPASDAVWDPNTNSFIGSTSNGEVSPDGNYLPPEGTQITEEGKLVMTSGNQKIEIPVPEPVITDSNIDLGEVVTKTQDNITSLTTTQVQNNTETNSYTSPSQTNYSTSAPTETQVINQISRGNLNITIIDR